MNWKVALFDLDGTLTDPEEGIVKCVQYAHRRLGRPVPPAASLRPWIGPPLLGSFLDAFDGDEDLARQGVAQYRERFSEVGMLENRLIPGIDDALDELKRRSIRCLVVTSKPTVYASQIVEHFDLDGRLDVVYGSELDGRLTDKSDLLAHVLEHEEFAASDAVMIGDRHHDVVGARNNGIDAMGVTWGFGSRQELIDAGASLLVDRVPDLIAHWQ